MQFTEFQFPLMMEVLATIAWVVSGAIAVCDYPADC